MNRRAPFAPALLALILAAPACSRCSGTGGAPPSDAGAPSPAPSAAFGDGPHDFQGTLASAGISMHLVRHGATLSGVYNSPQSPQPIALVGTVDDAGHVALTGRIDGRINGTFKLSVAGGVSLDGTWTDASGSKTFPVRLDPPVPRDR